MASWTRVSPVPSFPAYTGPYYVGTVDLEVPSAELLPSPTTSSTPVNREVPETVSFRCFYPCQPPKQASRAVLWVPEPQKETMQAFYANILKTSPALSTVFRWLSHLLYYTTIPATRNAPLLQAPHASKRWPVLVFSHGIAGSRNSYSHVCGSLATHGIVVLAADHRDGSSPVQFIRETASTKARTLNYRQLSYNPSPENYQGRDEQLRIRLAELSLAYEVLLKVDSGKEISNLDPNDDSRSKTKDGAKSSSQGLLSMFHGTLDIHRPGKITWAGHSFGGATTVQFLKSIFYASSSSPLLLFPPSHELKAQIIPSSPMILLDLWAFPLNSSATKDLASRPLPCFAPNGPGGDSVLTILSESFYNWKGNFIDVKKALSDPTTDKTSHSPSRPQAHIFYPLRSAHLSQSDYGILFPHLTKLFTKAEEPARTLRLNVRAILEVMRRAGVDVADTSAADMEQGEVAAGDAASQGEKGDSKILSRTEGSVRGWVALRVDEDDSRQVANAEKKMGEVPGEKSQRQQERQGNNLLRRSSSREAEAMGMPGTELAGAAAATAESKA